MKTTLTLPDSPSRPKPELLSVRKLAFGLGLRPERLHVLARTAGSFYDPFDRPQIKPDRIKWRHIDNPFGDMKLLQRAVNKKLLRQAMLALPVGMVGGVAGRSVRDNAIPHLGQEMVVNLDIRDCYPTTGYERVFGVWRGLGYGRDASRVLTQVTTLHKRLPQGAPTSPTLCNLVLLPMFEEITAYTAGKDIGFTLYVDDITISGPFSETLGAIDPIIRIVQRHGYRVHPDKIAEMPRGKRQETTGLVLNSKLSLQRQKLERLRHDIVSHLKERKPISSRTRDSIVGRLDYAKQFEPRKAEKLADLVEALFDGVEVFPERRQRSIRRKCRYPDRHKRAVAWHLNY